MTGRKKLFGVQAVATWSGHFLGNAQIRLEAAIVDSSLAVAATAGRGCAGGIDNLRGRQLMFSYIVCYQIALPALSRNCTVKPCERVALVLAKDT